MLVHAQKIISSDYPTTLLATSAILSPAWVTMLDTISEDASKFLPILGVILVCVQIYVYLKYHNVKDE
jgi:hypothetical protein